MPPFPPLSLSPIGVIHTPYQERVDAPRQTSVAWEVAGTVVLEGGRDFEHALSDVESWDFLWLLYWFHHNEGWRPKVLPPRSTKRRGVFATRAPHRPNPIGLSVVKLERVEGLVLHVRGVDMLDGTPLLDIKPYVPYADSLPRAGDGWLGDEGGHDPRPSFRVQWSARARERVAWLKTEVELDLVTPVESTLRLGPQPHPYRRIRAKGGALELAVKAWRVRFRVTEEDQKEITVDSVHTGYRPRELAVGKEADLEGHRAFVRKFGL